MGWVPWCKAAALAFPSAEAFRLVMDRTHNECVLVITTKAAQKPLSVPPPPLWDLLSLEELSAQDVGEEHVLSSLSMRFLSSWVQMEASGGQSRSSRYLCFERPIVEYEYFSDCTLCGRELCCQLQQSWWIELTFPLHVSALSTLFLCPQMNLLWNVLAGLL